jgi:hypothetical protein
MVTALVVDAPLNEVGQAVKDEAANASPLMLSTKGVGVTGNLGIGTNSPRNRLHIADDAPADANGAQLRISETGGNSLLLGRTVDYGFVQSHSSEPLALNPLGNPVGIGTTTPKAALEVHGGTPDDANTAQFAIYTSRGNFLLIGRASDYGFVQSHNREPLALNPLGNNVGIGTTTPKEALEVDGNILVSGDVQLAGADCAEDFDIEEDEVVDPGTVMVIGPAGLKQCTRAYDPAAAGVVAGGGDVRPGILLGRQPGRGSRIPITLTGTVYCKVDAHYGAVSAGDMLTTSGTPGHAMKASDAGRAHGAIIGKALKPLLEGRGLIPMLAMLG